MTSDPWQALHNELDQWESGGQAVTLWWRDDDAVGASDQLSRLLEIAGKASVPLCLAVVPADCQPALVEAVEQSEADVSIAVHGWSHTNRAADGEKKSEFPDSRPFEMMSAEAAQGLKRINQTFGERSLGVFVPPWNRIGDAFAEGLPAAGYRGLSTYKARPADAGVAGLAQVNTHADIINWPDGRTFAGTGAVLDLIVGHLAARRLGTVKADEPTGLLTHHLVQQNDAFGFIARYLRETTAHPAVRWLGGGQVFDG
jgi:hypothetical protein